MLTHTFVAMFTAVRGCSGVSQRAAHPNTHTVRISGEAGDTCCTVSSEEVHGIAVKW